MKSSRSLMLASLVLVCGCSSTEPLPPLYPATGTIVQKGQPVVAGGLILVPEPPKRTIYVVNANVSHGQFRLETSRTRPEGGVDLWPGAPAGTYKAIYHPPSNGAMSGLEVTFPETVTIDGKGASTIPLTLPEVMPQGRGVPRDDDPDARKQTADPKK